jgi:hypothetical protein
MYYIYDLQVREHSLKVARRKTSTSIGYYSVILSLLS